MPFRKDATDKFNKLKESHKKIKHIKHENQTKPQAYITNKNFTNTIKSILFNLRSRSHNELNENFHHMYSDYTCFLCEIEADSQEYDLTCHVLKNHLTADHLEQLKSVKYSDIFGNCDQQLKITNIFIHIILQRQQLRDQKEL